ncbi:MAG: hypothetical protein O7F56_03360 [Acidobacteria bacterium]|nr:hypothetical protein [Acidobacteriota bacterium]
MTSLLEPTSFPIWSALTLGFVLGLRHAFDPDHLVAVSTIVSEHRTLWKSSLVGASWGLGHTLALMAFGGAVLALRIVVTPELTRYLELGVAGVLVVLGASVLARLFRSPPLHLHSHDHDGVAHTHLHFHQHLRGENEQEHEDEQHHHRHHHLLQLGGKPFIVGLVHGMAGTGTLMLLVVGVIPSVLMSVFYILVFGLGSVGGMVLVSLVMSLPLALAGKRIQFLEKTLRVTAGTFSLAFGLFLAWRSGIF